MMAFGSRGEGVAACWAAERLARHNAIPMTIRLDRRKDGVGKTLRFLRPAQAGAICGVKGKVSAAMQADME
jgi:hypothetical protein